MRTETRDEIVSAVVLFACGMTIALRFSFPAAAIPKGLFCLLIGGLFGAYAMSVGVYSCWFRSDGQLFVFAMAVGLTLAEIAAVLFGILC